VLWAKTGAQANSESRAGSRIFFMSVEERTVEEENLTRSRISNLKWIPG
jgi:hypothetical protein